MISEIFIENKKVDLSDGLSNLLTLAIDDIKDIGSRNTTFSKTIILPGTAINNSLFGHIFDVTAMNTYNPALPNQGYNFNASKQAAVVIFQNHIQVAKGIVRLLKIVINDNIPEYEVAVFGELGGLVNAIGNGKLQDLDFSEYDHIYNTTNITGSWDNVTGGNVFYPLADYGNVSVNKVDYDIKAFRPALYVKEYIEKMFEDAGYSFESDIMETDRFKSLIIPHNQKIFTKNENVFIDALRDNTEAPGYDGTVIEGAAGSGNQTEFVYWDSAALINFSFTLAAAQYQDFTYTPVPDGIADVYVELAGNYSNDGSNIFAEFRKNGSTIAYIYFGDTGGVSEDYSFSVLFPDMPLATGDVLDVKLYSNGVGAYRVDVNTGIFRVTSLIPSVVEITNGDSIQINDTIPRNVLQRDFLSSVLKLFNLYVTEDKLKDKFLYITPYVDFYNVSGIVDWTYKLDRSKTIELTPMSELNARYYNFKFKSDVDYYNELYRKRYGEGYGDYLFDSEFAFSGEVSDIELVFSGTPLVGYAGVDKIVSTYYKLNNAIEDALDVNIRILLAKKITGVGSWAIKDGVSTLQAGLTTYGYAGHYDDPDAPANDIQFGVPKELFFTLVSGGINVNQFNVYWSTYMAEITDKDSKLLTATFKLTNSDIYNLDFGKFIYIDGSYFRLNKIIDWNASEPDLCQCELLKVIYPVY